MPDPIVDLERRIAQLEARINSSEVPCVIKSISADQTRITVTRESDDGDIDIEDVLNTFTTYAGGGVQYQKLDIGDTVMVRFPQGIGQGVAYTTALLPSDFDLTQTVDLETGGSIALNTFSNITRTEDGVLFEVNGDTNDPDSHIAIINEYARILTKQPASAGAEIYGLLAVAHNLLSLIVADVTNGNQASVIANTSGVTTTMTDGTDTGRVAVRADEATITALSGSDEGEVTVTPAEISITSTDGTDTTVVRIRPDDFRVLINGSSVFSRTG